MGVGPFIVLLYLNVSILKKLMVRSTWAGISIKRNKQSKRFIRKRFVNGHSSRKDNDRIDAIELAPLEEIEKNTSEGNGNKRRAENHSHKYNDNNDIDTGLNRCSTKKKGTKLGFVDDGYQTTNKRGEKQSFKLPGDDTTVANNVESEDNISSEKCLPRIHTYNDMSTGRNMVGLAWVTLAIVFVFMICHSIKWIANFYEMIMVRYLIHNHL